MTAKQSPLHDRHVALGAKFSSFGGWDMPLEYVGVLKEHAAVREAVGLFDVSHMGKLVLTGQGAADFINARFANDLGKIEVGKAQYTLCLDPDTAGVVDDIIVYLRASDDLLIVPNAANAAEVRRRLEAELPHSLSLDDQHESHAMIAVQGPKSEALMQALGFPTGHEYMSYDSADFGGQSVVVCRSGYTGERGYELIAPVSVAAELWDALLKAGKELGVKACGLGARDTLRTEMGYPLHGQDLSPEITPLMGGVGWAVGWNKPAFWGRDVLLAQREAGAPRRIRGLLAQGRGIPRPHMVVKNSDGAEVGEITSGTFSPTLRQGIALALLDSSINEGDVVSVDVRGRAEQFTVTRPPFVQTDVRGA